MTEPAERNLQVIRELYEAYRRADLEWLQQHTAPDIVLDVAGRSRISGRYEGMGAALAFGAGAEFQFVPESLVVEEMWGDEEGVRTITRISVRGRDRNDREMRVLQRYGFDEEGRISRVLFAAEDQEAFDRWIGPREPGQSRR